MIPNDEMLEIRPVTNGYIVFLHRFDDDKNAWVSTRSFVYSDGDVLIQILRDHLLGECVDG